jgi:hypothetical protein
MVRDGAVRLLTMRIGHAKIVFDTASTIRDTF